MMAFFAVLNFALIFAIKRNQTQNISIYNVTLTRPLQELESAVYTRSRWNSRNDRKYRAISHPQFRRNDVRNPQTCCGPFRDHYYGWVRLCKVAPFLHQRPLASVVENAFETKAT